jgi:hypothetical protein
MKTNTVPTNEKLPRYNHYVPRFILDNFTDRGKISILDKHTLKQFKLAPYRAIGEKDFNNVYIGDDVLSFEHKFTYLEDIAAPIITRIVQQKSLSALQPADEAALHMFVVVQLLRSKRRRLDQALIGAEIKKRWPEADLNPLRDQMTDDEFDKFFTLNFAFSHLDELTSALVPKHSYLILKECPGELYISDNPIVMHNRKQFGPRGNIGLSVPHIEIYYPLSSEIVLAYMCPLTAREIEEKLVASEREINALFSRKFLSPSGVSISDRLEIERCRAELKNTKDHQA